MKPSAYNYCTDLADGTTLLFNFYTLNLIALDRSESVLVGKILKHANRSRENNQTSGLMDLLIDKGFIIDEWVDELELLRALNHKSRTQQEHLSLTILPSLACNFRCIYCYETKYGQEMSREIEEALIHFVKGKVQKGGKLSVTWFGGEPLLHIDAIERLSRGLIEVSNNNDVGYSASIVTNGYLLDMEMAERLSKLRVVDAQVTLDGPPNVHDRRRPLKDGNETFQRILDNIKEAVGKISVSIRMNVDEENRGTITDLVDILVQEGLGERASFYLGQTYPYTAACGDIAGWCLTDEDFSLLELETLIEMVGRGLSWTFGMPTAKNHFCLADSENSHVITPRGGIINCWNEVDNSQAEVGHLLNPSTDKMKENIERWQWWNPFELECTNCVLLPVCMGGCPYLFQLTGELDCHHWKHHLKESLALYYYLKKIQREGAIIQQFQKAVEAVKKLKAVTK